MAALTVWPCGQTLPRFAGPSAVRPIHPRRFRRGGRWYRRAFWPERIGRQLCGTPGGKYGPAAGIGLAESSHNGMAVFDRAHIL